ncbi:MAG TPA: hypothetical protein VFD19_01245 [Clostridia bacterium]|nr:hypothetical protein [Clostridia bacterium]
MADHDFLEEIKKTEAEAASRVEKAREQAQLQRQMARQQATELIEETYRVAGALRQKKMNEAQKQSRDLISGDSSSNDSAPIDVSQDIMTKTVVMLSERIVSLLEHR